VLEQAVGAMRMLCLGPLVIASRNLHHGQMMIRRRTNGMAAGAILRVLAIFVLSALLFRLGWLNYRTSALLMIVGFAAEALAARVAVGRLAKGAVAESRPCRP
jgi:hypothetical protein